MSEIQNLALIKRDVSNAVWTHVGRSTVGFVKIQENLPTSLGSGTLVRFGKLVGILTCAHVIEALLKEVEIGILCFPVRATQIQTLRVSMATTDSITIGGPPWSEQGPDLAFLRLPDSINGDITRLATIANGLVHRQNIVAGTLIPTRTFCVVAGIVDELTKPSVITEIVNGSANTTRFEAFINIGHVFVDEDSSDRFRLQPVASDGVILPKSYKGTSGGGLWQFFLGQEDFSIIQVRLIGVAYWEKPIGDELHIIGHGQISVYDTLFKAINEKWSLT